ncbi:unnamed protein product [Rotaria magnacalcarata]
MQAVKFENDLYQDIVQEDFLDSYRNLTHKAVMALKWISTYCSQASYILKTDDDMIVNTFMLLKHLKFRDSYQMKQNNSIFCRVYESMDVFRDKNIKWYLSEKEYPPKKFPPFCSGSEKSSFIIHSLQQDSIREAAIFMANEITPFLALPIELIYLLLNHLDDFTTICSVRDVCTRLNMIIDTCGRYQM